MFTSKITRKIRNYLDLEQILLFWFYAEGKLSNLKWLSNVVTFLNNKEKRKIPMPDDEVTLAHVLC